MIKGARRILSKIIHDRSLAWPFNGSKFCPELHLVWW